MSEPTTPAPQSTQISLRDMGLKYLGAVQRVFDLATTTFGGLRCQTERDYDEFGRSVRFMPSQQQRLNFDNARQAAEHWLLKQLIADGLGLLIPFLEDTRSVASLARWKADGTNDQARLKEIMQDERQAFLRLPLEGKLQHVKEKFGLSAPNEAFIEGYMKLGQALVRGGTVAAADTTDGQTLVVKLAAVDLQAKAGETGAPSVTGRVVEVQKRFAVGEKIDFRKEEVLSLFASIAMFITGMMGALQTDVQKFIKNEAPEA